MKYSILIAAALLCGAQAYARPNSEDLGHGHQNRTVTSAEKSNTDASDKNSKSHHDRRSDKAPVADQAAPATSSRGRYGNISQRPSTGRYANQGSHSDSSNSRGAVSSTEHRSANASEHRYTNASDHRYTNASDHRNTNASDHRYTNSGNGRNTDSREGRYVPPLYRHVDTDRSPYRNSYADRDDRRDSSRDRDGDHRRNSDRDDHRRYIVRSPAFYHPRYGTIERRLPDRHVRIFVRNHRYYYYGGTFYDYYNGGYVIVNAPLGALVPVLPGGYVSFVLGPTRYFYFGGTYYIRSGQQYEVVEPPSRAHQIVQTAEQEMIIYPARGQSQKQLDKDRYECHVWAVGQTGFDPSANNQDLSLKPDYNRAMGACLEARGYVVK